MEIDLRKSLEMAFGHLNRFSVPGIGTFKKSYHRSEIDHRDKMVLPPQEMFELTKEGARLDASKEIEILVNFFFQQFKTTLEIARDAVRDLGDLIREEISSYDSYVILGIGEIRQNEVGEIVLLPQKDREQTTGNDFFGLAPVKYTLGMAGNSVPPPPVKEKKAEPEKAEEPIRLTKEPKTSTVSEKAAQPPVVPIVQNPAPEKKAKPVSGKPEKVAESTPVPPPAKTSETPPDPENPTPEPKKKRKVWKILLALTLIWGLIFACIWFRSELMDFGQGLFDKGSSEVITDADTDSGTDADVDTDLGTDTDPGTDTDTDLGTDTDIDLDTDTDVDTTVDTDTDTDTDFSSDIDFEGEFGEAPVPGQHYLIVGSSKNGRFAEKDARKYQKGAYKGKAVAPRMNGGFYKVSIYNSTDKMEVIQKMVEWKDTFKEGTWIYSPK